MKKGFELTGTDNNGTRHRYSFVKKESFKDIFLKFMEKLGFDPEKIKNQFFRSLQDDNGEEMGQIPVKVSEICDVCWNYQNKNYDVDVFYGFQKIIIVIRAKSKEQRFYMLDYLEESSDWIEIPEEKKAKVNKIITSNFKKDQ